MSAYQNIKENFLSRPFQTLVECIFMVEICGILGTIMKNRQYLSNVQHRELMLLCDFHISRSYSIDCWSLYDIERFNQCTIKLNQICAKAHVNVSMRKMLFLKHQQRSKVQYIYQAMNAQECFLDGCISYLVDGRKI
ncbi:unnamed protein product [Paramecium octaurelia]|uniref:Uncharacterized protein n=1 Tax=Paramecium octaurelia TaxID=43137 RepID=A0A8S1YC14_PAROT|nr:unnamed protein product [Paramecium octaurelia]